VACLAKALQSAASVKTVQQMVAVRILVKSAPVANGRRKAARTVVKLMVVLAAVQRHNVQQTQNRVLMARSKPATPMASGTAERRAAAALRARAPQLAVSAKTVRRKPVISVLPVSGPVRVRTAANLMVVDVKISPFVLAVLRSAVLAKVTLATPMASGTAAERRVAAVLRAKAPQNAVSAQMVRQNVLPESHTPVHLAFGVQAHHARTAAEKTVHAAGLPVLIRTNL